MDKPLEQIVENAKQAAARPAVSFVLSDGTIVEMILRPAEGRTLFCISENGELRYEENLIVDGQRLVPYSPSNNLLRHEVVLLPSAPEEYGTEDQLVAEVRDFIHRYVDVSGLFEKVASYYVMLSWVYDAFSELPYLRLRGDPGSGKTRFLLTVGSLCYKPIFASGASTVSPLFRILDAFRGTLIIDEGDFRLSDEKAELVKILNNGNARGFPVLRSEMTPRKEFNPTAYAVFGPKLVATRGYFEDRALESRCLTEEMGLSRLRDDIPINLDSRYKDEALRLRNKLLLFRFRHLAKSSAAEGLVDRSIEPRLAQIFVPLLSIIEDEAARKELRDLARRYHRELIAERGFDMETQLLEVIRDILADPDGRLTVKEITRWFADRHQEEYDKKVTPKWIGNVLRKKLRLKTERTRTGFVIPAAETPKLERLFQKYGLASLEADSSSPDAEEASDISDSPAA